MSGYAERIRELRERFGKSQTEMAALLDMTDMSYFDLEAYDDELSSAPSLEQVRRLAETFGISTAALFVQSGMPTPIRHLLYSDLVDRIQAHLNSSGSSLSHFEDQVGWSLEDFLASEQRALTSYPVDFLKSLCAALRVNWLEALP